MEITDVLFARHLNGGGGGDITVESLSVTQNGTYTAPQGKAYSPVTVEVQPPANSYQLKSITTPTPLATFEASAMPMPSLKVSVEAKQDLHGYDKPWVGGAGKNKLDSTKFTRTNKSGQSNVNWARWDEFIPCTQSSYTLSCGFNVTLYALNVDLYDENQSLIEALDLGQFSSSGKTFSVENQSAKYMKISIYNNSSMESYDFSHAQLELGSQATSFEPYSNICPISGWDEANVSDVGKNLLKVTATTTTVNGVTFTVNDDGSITCSGTATGLATLNVAYDTPISPKYGKVILSGLANTSNIIWNYVAGLDENNVELFMDSIATTANKTFNLAKYPSLAKLRVSIKRYQNSAVSGTVYPQLEVGETATTFEPYVEPNIYTISLGQTVYGGEVDVVNGTSGNKVTHQLETISGGVSRTDSSGYLFVVKDLNVPDITDYETVTPYIISNYLTPYSVNDLRANAVFGFTQYNKRLYIRLGADITTVEDANAFLASNPLQIKYELATPTTLTTQPTPIKSLNGQNNLSVDCGEVIEGEYFKAL